MFRKDISEGTAFRYGSRLTQVTAREWRGVLALGLIAVLLFLNLVLTQSGA